MDDVREVANLLSVYCQFIDDGRLEEWAGLFTEDGTFTYPGREPVRPIDIIEAYRAGTQIAEAGGLFSKHQTLNPAIDVGASEGNASSDFILLRMQLGAPPYVYAMGRYTDRLIKQAGVWKFAERVARFHRDIAPADWPMG